MVHSRTRKKEHQKTTNKTKFTCDNCRTSGLGFVIVGSVVIVVMVSDCTVELDKIQCICKKTNKLNIHTLCHCPIEIQEFL